MKSNAKKMMTIAIAALGMVACSNNELFDEAISIWRLYNNLQV